MEMTDREVRVLINMYDVSASQRQGRVGEKMAQDLEITRMQELETYLKERSIPVVLS